MKIKYTFAGQAIKREDAEQLENYRAALLETGKGITGYGVLVYTGKKVFLVQMYDKRGEVIPRKELAKNTYLQNLVESTARQVAESDSVTHFSKSVKVDKSKLVKMVKTK